MSEGKQDAIADDEWQEDRPVFDRGDGKQPGDKAGALYVTKEARKHWSDKNPKKFTPDIALKIITYLGGSGCCLETAAAAAGINKCTLHEWLRLAERSKPGDDSKGTEELRAWKKQLDEAECMTEMRAAQGIMDAGHTDWKAWAWFLERRYPQRWGRKDTTMHANPDGTPLTPPSVEVVLTKTPTSPEDPTDDGAEPPTG